MVNMRLIYAPTVDALTIRLVSRGSYEVNQLNLSSRFRLLLEQVSHQVTSTIARTVSITILESQKVSA